MKKLQTATILILVFSLLTLSMASCAGKFSLSHKLLNWNLSLNKWLGSFVMFVFIIVPVYGITLLIDWIILNVIEFYTGDNPVASNDGTTKTAMIDGHRMTMTFHDGHGVNVDIISVDPQGATKTLIVRTTADGMAAKLIENGQTRNITTRPVDDGGLVRCVDETCRYVPADTVWETAELYAPVNELTVANN